MSFRIKDEETSVKWKGYLQRVNIQAQEKGNGSVWLIVLELESASLILDSMLNG